MRRQGEQTTEFYVEQLDAWTGYPDPEKTKVSNLNRQEILLLGKGLRFYEDSLYDVKLFLSTLYDAKHPKEGINLHSPAVDDLIYRYDIYWTFSSWIEQYRFYFQGQYVLLDDMDDVCTAVDVLESVRDEFHLDN